MQARFFFLGYAVWSIPFNQFPQGYLSFTFAFGGLGIKLSLLFILFLKKLVETRDEMEQFCQGSNALFLYFVDV